ncbi:head GIN domain-containing protein [Spirosoma spitsbergense]|jgi:hypothetical protein|uniref:head GIN domain-containing protein n=1 Tax=Spirosoma spitsbergense TaxID=431554 RepID=UPI00039A1F26|nr:head GIN domain-containing protein [Spirosoma spitsbergense]
MKGLILSIMLLVTVLNTASDDWKKDRPVSGFTGLNVSNGIVVYLTQGNAEKLTLEAKGVDEDQVVSEVRNGTLKLYIERKGFSGWTWGRNTSVKAYLTFRQLQTIRAGGGADVIGQGQLSFNDLSLDASGGSNLKLDFKAHDLNASASGGADALLKGSARMFNASGSGGSNLDARKLVVESCNANSSGGSDVYVNARNELKMKASGGSDIYYYGSAKVVARSESGGSDIIQKD